MNTFHSMNKTKKETLAKHRVIQAIDLIEDTGPEAIELSIQMHFHAPYTLAPSAAITALVMQADAAEEKPITVFAAASMKNALDEVNALLTNRSRIKVVASYAAS